MSRKSLRFLIPAVFGLILISQFNNCENFSSVDQSSSLLSIQCVGAACYSASDEALQLDVTAGSLYGVAANVQTFDLGGFCDQGGYPRNKVIWELYLNNNMINSSQLLGTNGTCSNGRFIIRVDLTAARAGLMDPSNSNARVSYGLDVEVIGIDAKSIEHRNQANARKRVILNPL